MRLPGRAGAPVDWLVVGLGNPGSEYRNTPHNIGFEVAEALAARWRLRRPRSGYGGLITDGQATVGVDPVTAAPIVRRVAVLWPQTYMNDAGRSVGPARGALQTPVERVLVLHDEIDLPFGEIRVRRGGGLAGHNGLKSIRRALGSTDFHRVRVGVDRPPSTDPERVAAFVLGKFRQPRAEVDALVERAADAAERLLGETAES